jgi:hypothetical protein
MAQHYLDSFMRETAIMAARRTSQVQNDDGSKPVAMHLSNSTANQHFLSRAEQELNALNPNARSENQRIYSFSLSDREAYRIQLDGHRGKSISKNLALRDLFSFSVIEGDKERSNLESLFGQYEANMKTNTLELLRKLRSGEPDIKEELLGVFVSKFMNFLRNPYSIRKVLNTIGGLLQYHPTDPELQAHYQTVLAGRKPHQEHLCQQLGIDAATYQKWLAALFMALHRPVPTAPNLMEATIKETFESRSHYAQVAVCQYVDEHADKRCLLSDRGFINPLPDSQGLSFSFNLNANAFINYTFLDIEQFSTGRYPPSVIELFKAQPKSVQVHLLTNKLEMLASYNRHVVYQCARGAYCSSASVYGVLCVPFQ